MSAEDKPTPISDVLVEAGLGKLGTDPAPENVEAALRSLAEKLEGADSIRRASAREAAIKLLKAAGASSPGALVDAALGGTKSTSEAVQQGSVMALVEPEPWEHKVDGAALLKELCATFTRYVSLPEHAEVALALWTLHAHAHDAASISPILALTSPEKRCGKSTTLTLIGAIVPRPLSAANIPPAALFRSVQKFRPTLLVDEADSFLIGKHADDSLRGILNSGHLRSGAQVVRCVGENHEPRLFKTWGPKVIALIGRLPSTLEDRSIPVALQRQAPGTKRERLRLDRLHEMKDLRAKAAKWTADHMAELKGADPAVPEALHDRAQDNWRTLLAISDAAGGEWPERARTAALKLSGAMDDGESVGPLLLADLKALFDGEKVDRLRSAEIVAALVEMEHRPWPEWKQGRPITVRQLARLLAPFGVHPKGIRLSDDSTPRGYLREQFKDAWRRYTPFSSATLQQRSNDAENSAFPSATGGNGVALQNPEKSASTLDCCSVADEKGEAAPELALVPDPDGERWPF